MITLMLILIGILIVASIIAVIAAAVGVVVLPILDILIGIGIVMLLFKAISWLKSLGHKDDKES